MLALGGADVRGGVVLVNHDHCVDAVGERVHQRVFDVLGVPRRHRLHDGIAALERMQREARDVLQTAAAAHITLAVPFKARALRIERMAVAQRIKL